MEHYWRNVVLGHQRGLLSNLARGVLSCLSMPYRWIIQLRNRSYDQGWFEIHRIPNAVVVSVGNIVTGGTGKTPCIIKLAEEWADLPVGVVSRGYRSAAETKKAPTTLSQGSGPMLSAAECGDESFLIASRLPHLVVVVGKNRLEGAKKARASGASLLLLDDGMQHRRLARDFEVVVVDATNPLGTGHLLPRGFLREPLSNLKRADLIIFNHVTDAETYQRAVQAIAPYTDAPTVGMQLGVTGVFSLAKDPIDLSNVSVGMFCGIAQPEKFHTTLANLGMHVVASCVVDDHQSTSIDRLNAFATQCQQKGASWLVCTEKDWVKLPQNLKTVLPLAWVKTHLDVVQGADIWSAFLQKVRDAHVSLRSKFSSCPFG